MISKCTFMNHDQDDHWGQRTLQICLQYCGFVFLWTRSTASEYVRSKKVFPFKKCNVTDTEIMKYSFDFSRVSEFPYFIKVDGE